MNYDSMSVHEFVTNLDFPDEDLPIAESALRKAVIREARVGTIEFNSAFEDGIGVVLGDDLDGYYDLIPKETP